MKKKYFAMIAVFALVMMAIPFWGLIAQPGGEADVVEYTFALEGGHINGDFNNVIRLRAGGEFDAPVQEPERDGYDFVLWVPGTDILCNEGAVIGRTRYAMWAPAASGGDGGGGFIPIVPASSYSISWGAYPAAVGAYLPVPDALSSQGIVNTGGQKPGMTISIACPIVAGNWLPVHGSGIASCGIHCAHYTSIPHDRVVRVTARNVPGRWTANGWRVSINGGAPIIVAGGTALDLVPEGMTPPAGNHVFIPALASVNVSPSFTGAGTTTHVWAETNVLPPQPFPSPISVAGVYGSPTDISVPVVLGSNYFIGWTAQTLVNGNYTTTGSFANANQPVTSVTFSTTGLPVHTTPAPGTGFVVIAEYGPAEAATAQVIFTNGAGGNHVAPVDVNRLRTISSAGVTIPIAPAGFDGWRIGDSGPALTTAQLNNLQVPSSVVGGNLILNPVPSGGGGGNANVNFNFNYAGLTNPPAVSRPVGEAVLSTNVPTDPVRGGGYTFAGWQINGAGTVYNATQVAAHTVPTGGVTYVASWTPPAGSANVNFNFNYVGLTNPASVSRPIGEAVLAANVPADPVRGGGYTFAGWQINGVGTVYSDTQVAAHTVLAGGVTYVASWTPPGGNANVNFDFNYAGLTNPSAVSRPIGQAVLAANVPADPVRGGGYTFAGWQINGVGTVYNATQVAAHTVPTGGVTYIASWTPPGSNANVNFNLNYAGLTNPVAVSRPVGQAVLAANVPADPVRGGGYTFAGWQISGVGTVYNATQVAAHTVPAGGVTYVASWTPPGGSANVNFNFNYAGLTNPATVSRPIGEAVLAVNVPGDPTRGGHSFAGWQINGVGTVYSGAAVAGHTVLAGSVTYIASWTPLFTVTFDLGGGTHPAEGPAGFVVIPNIASGGSITAAQVPAVAVLPAVGLARPNHQFHHWATPGALTAIVDPVTVASNITANVTFVAIWRELHTVTFNLNGGHTVPGNNLGPITVQIAHGTTVGMSNIPTVDWPLHTFNGWLQQGVVGPTSAALLADVVVIGPTTFTADWSLAQATITFGRGSGTINAGFSPNAVGTQGAANGPVQFTFNAGSSLTLGHIPLVTPPAPWVVSHWQVTNGSGYVIGTVEAGSGLEGINGLQLNGDVTFEAQYAISVIFDLGGGFITVNGSNEFGNIVLHMPEANIGNTMLMEGLNVPTPSHPTLAFVEWRQHVWVPGNSWVATGPALELTDIQNMPITVDVWRFGAVWAFGGGLSHNATFSLAGGSYLPNYPLGGGPIVRQFDQGSQIPNAIVPVTSNLNRPGFNFSHWVSNGVEVPSPSALAAPDGDVYFTAIWNSIPQAGMINANFDFGGGVFAPFGEFMISNHFGAGTTLGAAVAPFQPSRPGFIFDGWVVSGSALVGGFVLNDGDSVDPWALPLDAVVGDQVSFRATWLQSEITATFDLNGGTFPPLGAANVVIENICVLTGMAPGDVPMPSSPVSPAGLYRVNHTFAHWALVTGPALAPPQQVDPANLGFTPTTDLNFTAVWEYQVRFYLLSGEYNGNAGPIVHTFLDCAIETHPVLVAGQVPAPTSPIVLPTGLYRPNFTFGGWVVAGTDGPVVDPLAPAFSGTAVSFVATWSADDIPGYFVPRYYFGEDLLSSFGGALTRVWEGPHVAYNTQIPVAQVPRLSSAVPAPSAQMELYRVGYTFLHWVVSGSALVGPAGASVSDGHILDGPYYPWNLETAVTDVPRISFRAVWQSNAVVTHMVTFYLNQGNISGNTTNPSFTVVNGAPVSSGGTVPDIPTLQRTDFIFAGWTQLNQGPATAPSNVVENHLVFNDVTYVAQWTPIGPGQSPGPGASPGPGQSPDPGASPGPGQSPDPGASPGPGQSPDPGASPGPGQSPDPGASPGPGQSPDPGASPGPGQSPDPGASPGPGQSPDPGASPGPGQSPQPGASPGPGQSPTPGQSPGPGQSPTPPPLPRVTLTFNAGNGRLPSGASAQITGYVGFRAVRSNFPTPIPPTGYTFVGWYLGGQRVQNDLIVNNNMTLIAHYQRTLAGRNYTLTFNPNHGTLPAGTVNPQTHLYGTHISSFPTPTRSGFIFAGWMQGNQVVATPFTIRGNTTLTAVWVTTATPTPSPVPTIPPGHLVAVFVPSPGSFAGNESGIRTGVYGFTVNSMPTPTRQGYTFVGWHHNGVRVNFPLAVRSDMTIGALWSPSVPGRDNPQTSPMAVTFTIFGAVMLVGIAAFGIMKITGKQMAAQGQYRSDLTRYNREERIVDMLKGGGKKK